VCMCMGGNEVEYNMGGNEVEYYMGVNGGG
jgi:hypothetical protein